MRILVTNDDGIHAPGLDVAEKIARELSDDVWVVAPETDQSGASHSLTLILPLRVRKIERHRFAVAGTPTDCVMMACLELMKKTPPDLILSGVNRGGNLADDVTYSGTVAAAMEGCTLGVPSIALSQVDEEDHRGDVDWSPGAVHGPALIRRLVKIGWPAGTLINVNFPPCAAGEVKGVALAAQGARDLQGTTLEARVDARGRPYYWLGFRNRRSKPHSGTDLHAVAAKKIAVTPLHLNLTETRVLGKMRRSLGESLAKR